MAKRDKDSQEMNDWELANFYVNETAGNKTQAYKLWCQAHNIDYGDSTCHTAAFRQFEKPEIRAYIETLKEENRKKYAEMRDNNISNLYSIATNLDNKTADRIAAVKELNSMFGYNQHNFNVDANASIELVIE